MDGPEGSINRLQWPARRKARVLFVCQGNTCRSMMAERIARAMHAAVMDAESAGFRPGGSEDARRAIDALLARGIGASDHRPRDIRQVDVESFDVVVAMDGARAADLRARFPAFAEERLIAWEIRDPFGGSPSEYEHCAGRLERCVAELAGSVGARG